MNRLWCIEGVQGLWELLPGDEGALRQFFLLLRSPGDFPMGRQVRRMIAE